jgi:hypothetical protein
VAFCGALGFDLVGGALVILSEGVLGGGDLLCDNEHVFLVLQAFVVTGGFGVGGYGG